MEAGHWERYALERPQRRFVNAAGANTWFNWTPYPDHGPGLEVLDLRPGSRVLDLGCGKGGNLAHVQTQGHCGIGVDLSRTQISCALTRWPHLTLVCGNALAYLESADTHFDAVYSVFGALLFVDPDAILPAVHRRLRGTLAFSYARMNAVSSLPCWDLEPEEWAERLGTHGFVEIELREVPAPDGAERARRTILIRAVRPD